MPSVARLGDFCSGHDCWPPRVNNKASESVFANSLGWHRETDGWTIHCCEDSCHDSVLKSGSSTVFINSLQGGRIGDPVKCGSTVIQGSSNVFCGG